MQSRLPEEERNENMNDRGNAMLAAGKRTPLKFIKGFFIFLLFLIAGEGFLRLFPTVLSPQLQIQLQGGASDWWVPDPELGFLAKPNQHLMVRTSDFTGVEETDHYGFSNRGPWPATVDILFLGDSLISGAGVGIDGQFSSLLAHMLPGTKVINLGLSGASAEHQYRIYKRFGISLHPKLVISSVYLTSDVRNAVRYHSWLNCPDCGEYDSFRLHFNPKRRAPPSTNSVLGSWKILIKQSFLFMALRDVGQTKQTLVQDRLTLPNGEEIFLSIPTLQQLAQITPAEPGFDYLANSLSQIQKLADSQKAEYLVLLIPGKEEIFGAGKLPALLKSHDIFVQRLKEQRLPFLDLYSTIRERGQSRSPFYTRDIHLNGFGNQIVAGRLCQWIEERPRRAEFARIASDSQQGIEPSVSDIRVGSSGAGGPQ
jgi:lysophospholipase L1-like esterase